MRSILCVLTLTIGVAVVNRLPQANPDDVTAAILHIHELDRRAHLKGDAADLESRLGDRIVVLSEGNITTESNQEMYKRFVDYFQRTKHSAWEDVETPVIRVSQDRTMAWRAFNVRSQ